MKRRDPLTTLATAPLPGLDSAYLAAREKLAPGKPLDTPILGGNMDAPRNSFPSSASAAWW